MREYKASTIECATQEQLVVIVFEGILSSLKKARIYLTGKKSGNGIGYIEAAHNELTRARALVVELLSALNEREGGEIAQNLKGIYAYLLDLLTVADLTKSCENIDLACNAVVPLWDAFKDVAGKKRGSPPRQQIEVLG